MKVQKITRPYLVLTPTEEKVVRFLTERKGLASVTDISNGVDLARTSIYNAVRVLIEKDLITKNGLQYQLIASLRPYKGQHVNVKDSITTLLQEILRLKRGEVVHSIESDEEISELIKKEGGLPDWQKQVADRSIVLKGVGSTRGLSMLRAGIDDTLRKDIQRRSGSARFLEDVLEGPGVLVSFRQSVIFYSRKRDYFYRIDDPYVAKFVQNVTAVLYSFLEHHPTIES